jgi:hypothetical protein
MARSLQPWQGHEVWHGKIDSLRHAVDPLPSHGVELCLALKLADENAKDGLLVRIC